MTTPPNWLDQADVWQDDDGTWRAIAAIPIGRALHIIGGLELHAETLALQASIRQAADLLDDDFGNGDLPTQIEDTADQAQARHTDPHAWIRNRPFYRALAAQIGHDLGWDVTPREATT